MSNQRISDLDPASTPLEHTEEIEILQSGLNVRVVLSELARNVGVVEFNIDPTTGDHQEGKLYYDNEDQTLSMMTFIEGVIVQFSRELHIEARNVSGAEIPNGTPVYIDSAIGEQPTIDLAQADALSTSGVIGLTTHDFPNNSNGLVTPFGLVRSVDTSAFLEGDYLYLSETAPGEIINTLPASGYIVFLGRCLYSHAVNGKILVFPSQMITAV